VYAYIGSRTTRERNARGDGITVCRVAADGSLDPVQVLGGLENPSFLALNRRGNRLYTVHGDGSDCSAFDVDDASGRLTRLQTRDFAGRNPVHLALDPSQRRLIVSSHLTGEVVVMPIGDDGLLSEATQRVSLPGTPGPHRIEQPFSKPHHNPFDPSGRFVVVPDKGLDRIFVFRAANGRLEPTSAPWVQTREGAGPRHVAFHPSGQWMYAVNELDSTVTAYAFDRTTGALTPFQWAPLLPDTFTGNSRAAGIEISQEGRFLYASNRGCDTIEAFAVDAATGRLAHLQSRSSEGRTPRFFTQHPDGTALYVLNEDSDSIAVIERSQGMLGRTTSSMRCGSPVCMVFRP
jgi:6-phosphogluconolactonase